VAGPTASPRDLHALGLGRGFDVLFDLMGVPRVIGADQQKYTGHVLDRPRHTQQLDCFVYEHDLRAREIPAGLRRAERLGAPTQVGGGS
jgi:hypothetical protein